MTDLEFKIDLLKVQLNVLELDDRLPSFKARLYLNIAHPTGEFNYLAEDIWFECTNWSDFTSKISSINNDDDAVVLTSMSEQFILKLALNDISILIKEVSFHDFIIELKHFSGLTEGDFYVIKKAICGFDRWWE
jgi:hypothetical protein